MHISNQQFKKIFDGFTAVYSVSNPSQDDGIGEKDTTLPAMEVGSEPKFVSLNPKQNFTEPPSRYTEASLVKTLEELGIGRPSTYSPTISTIIDRGYVEKEKKQLVPTDLGFVVNKVMEDNFRNIVDVKFTADMESRLDSVEEGKERWQNLIEDFYPPFEESLEEAFKTVERIEIPDEVSDIPCDKCGAMMVYKTGRFGRFLACPNYPECKTQSPLLKSRREMPQMRRGNN